MNILDNLEKAKELDSQNSVRSIDLLDKQCLSCYRQVSRLSFPKTYKKANNILFAGMGGSSYAGRIIKELYQREIAVPVDTVSDYFLPEYAGKNTLVFISSYSGNTEEAISCARQALERGAMSIAITSGGELGQMFQKEKKPAYIFRPVENPSQQPRLAQGYMVLSPIVILSSLGYISLSETDIMEIIGQLQVAKKRYKVNLPSGKNYAKKLAQKVSDKYVNLVSAGFLKGVLHAVRNPFNETSKHWATYFDLPELNHHLLEGLSYPKSNKNNLYFFLISSDFFSDKLRLRMKLTQEVLEKFSSGVEVVNLTFKSTIGQVFEVIQLFSYLTYYLALVHRKDPAKIPWVNYFKKRLAKEEK